MRKYFPFWCSLLFSAGILMPVDLHARNTKIDSLRNALGDAKEDTNKVYLLNDIGKELINTGNYDSAIKYASDAKKLAEKRQFKKGIAKSFHLIGLVHDYRGNYPEALKNYFQALKIREEVGDQQGLLDTYNNIGFIYVNQRNYPEALKNLLSALKISEQLDDKKGIAEIYVNTGLVYFHQQNYSEALKNYFQALKISKDIGYNQGIASCYINIGNIYYTQHNYNSALDNYLLALKIQEETREQVPIIGSYINIGSVYIKQKQYNDARKYLTHALQESKNTGIKEYLKDCYSSLAELAEATVDYKNAYAYQKLYSEIKDSLLNENSNRQIAEMKTRYETEKKDKEIELKTVKIEKQQAAIRYILGSVAALIIFVIIYFRLYNQKRKTSFKHQVLETEMKALRSQMNPHFTFNVLNSIQYYIGGNDMKSAQLYLNKFSGLIRMILEQSRNAYITLGEEITMLNLYLELEKMLFEKKFNYTIEIDSNLNTEIILIPSMFIQPIVENSLKHGLEHKKGESLITISFSQRNSALLCTVTDNGIGRAEAEKLKAIATHKSAATSIIKERMEALSAIYNIQLSYKTEDLFDKEGKPAGTRVSIEIPMKASPSALGGGSRAASFIPPLGGGGAV